MANTKQTAKKKTVKTRKRVSRNIEKGQVHITTSFNNNLLAHLEDWGLKALRKAHLLLLKLALNRQEKLRLTTV